MKLFNKLISFLSFGLQGKCEEEVINTILFINLLNFAGVLFFTVFGLFALLRGEIISGLVLLATSCLILGNIRYVKKTFRYSVSAKFSLILVALVLFLLFILDGSDGSIILWFPLIPLVSVLTLGHKNGSITSLIFLLLSAILFLLPDYYPIRPDFSPLFTIRLAGLYIALYLVASIFEYYRINYLRTIEMQMLEAKNELKLKESFISKLSHQIRTPLSNIMLVSHMVNKVDLTEEQREMMETIIASANNLVNTIENLAEIAEVDIESKKSLQNVSFNLHKTINSAIKLFTVQKEPVVDFFVTNDEKLETQELVGDPVKLKQILLNLIETILKNKRSGKIKISVITSIHSHISDITEVRYQIKNNQPIDLIPLRKETPHNDSKLIIAH